MFAVRDKRPMRTVTVVPLLLIPLSVTNLTGQDTLTAGDKVRVTTEEERVVGYWVSSDATRLIINSEKSDEELALRLGAVSRLELSTGQKSKWLVGAGVGLGLGAAATAVFTAVFLAGFCSGSDTDCDGSEYLTAFAILAVPPTIVGAIIGALIKVDRWETVPLNRIRVSLTPRGGGLEVTAKFVF